MQVMLKTMLDDERISYQGLMEKILEDKGQVPIPLTLAVIRVFLNIPPVSCTNRTSKQKVVDLQKGHLP